MPIHALIPSRTLLIAVDPDGSWSLADDGTPGSADVDFRLEITDDGGSGCLLVCSSLDGRLAADHWFASLGEAQAFAADAFGIEAQEWAATEG
ncbi:hypothetical protein [Acidovorax sp. A1169]|uniref:hypothetical protein n=1 Tax=Acidovorax sp. A1169 TaxID=3059524 RepID=UPI002737E3CC|nr:hypothetical protein [Acidovorax sp. A1169]MDP4078979.1 hypothetical protein [Acidovorax sp. A1169]